ncbi:MAG: 4-alpha-glucanotransferase [Chloroflexi bacterium]|nr:4-alpha-glucanotransferase [Chloroflexota bacterium]
MVPDEYTDAYGRRRPIDPEARRAVLAAMGIDITDRDRGRNPVAVARRGERLPAGGEVVLEDGTTLGYREEVPADVPYGYHRFHSDGHEQLLLVGPGRCHLPAGLREWGWSVQLPALRSRRSWGIGDLRDLGTLASWTADHGGGFLAVSPLGAPNPGPDPDRSPYYPSTRRFLNPVHLCVEAVPGADALGELGAAGQAMNADRRIGRGRALAHKLDALERIWAAGLADLPALDAYRREGGLALERWATFVLLTERFGPGWQGWPAEYRAPAGRAVLAAAQAAPDRIDFHSWVQSLLDRQLAGASAPVRRIADVPVGVDPGGFDAWDWQEQLALGASIGVPADRFSAAGQKWGLPPFVPDRLREAGYRPFVETIRAQLRHAGGLRIDHVLGLFRLWCMPAAADPADGAYVRYPTAELLEILAIESERASAIIIGEDLGTVPPGVRRELRRRRILSTRLALFERMPPERYPRQVFAAVTTHDLPTIAGLWSGTDLEDQSRAGVPPDGAGLGQLRGRLVRASGLAPDAPVDEVVEAVHRRLARSPSMLVAATLEDALRVAERPNMPGTVSAQRDNWSVALPQPLERLAGDARVLRLVAALRR